MKLVPSFTFLALAAASVGAQEATVVLREGDPVLGQPAQTISSLLNTASTQSGLSSIGFSSTGAATLSHFWVGPGAVGAVTRTEATIGGYEQTSFETFYGIADGAQIAYSPSCNDTSSGATGLDAVWLDDVVIAIEDDPIPSLPGKVWRFGSRPTTTSNSIVYWVGGIDDGTSGANEGGGLFKNDAGVETALVITGDTFLGFASDGNAIDFDYRVSALGTRWIGGINIDTGATGDDQVVVIDGTPIVTALGHLREGDGIDPSEGGLPGEAWTLFDYMGITESGSWMVTGDTNAATTSDEVIMIDGVIAYREGDVIDGYTISGAIESASLSEDGNVAFVWDVNDASGTNIEALFLNDHILLKEGDLVDWDGDGFVDADAVLVDFTGSGSMTLGLGGIVAFTADIDVAGTVLEGYFVIDNDCLSADTYGVSIAAGGAQNLSIDAGPAHAFEAYLVAGSTSGTTPGIPFQGFTIPLNLDAYFNSTIAQANTGSYVMTFGVLDADGRASASLVLPPGAPVPPGTTAHHAFATFTLGPVTVTKVSGPISLALLP